MIKIIVAIDSFKGCLTSVEANQAAVEGILHRIPEATVVQIPVSDGGEGWLSAFQAAWGGQLVDVSVCDPLMRPIVAQYLMKDETAVIEIAKASGLTLLSREERNPMKATSYGTGQLVVDAVRRGCKHIIVGLGGSATSDCGIGMLRAVIDGLTLRGDCSRMEMESNSDISRIIAAYTDDEMKALDDVHFTIATDVGNPLCGENGAANVFGPQKGATPEMVRSLDDRARRFAEMTARHFGYDCQHEPGAGAAGGLGYAFLQFMSRSRRTYSAESLQEGGGVKLGGKDGVECRPGIDLILDAVGFEHHLEDATLVITGEGSADRQTLMGKLPFGILRRAKGRGVPVVLIAGRIKDSQRLLDAGFSRVACINPIGLPIEEAMNPSTAKRNISSLVSRLSD